MPVTDCLHTIFSRRAAEQPHRIAVTCGDHRLSYSELDRLSGELAERLRGYGVGPGVHVGVCVDRSVDLVVCVLAVVKAGGAYVPVDAEHPAARVAAVLAGSRVPVTVAVTRTADSLAEWSGPVLWADDSEDDDDTDDEDGEGTAAEAAAGAARRTGPSARTRYGSPPVRPGRTTPRTSSTRRAPPGRRRAWRCRTAASWRCWSTARSASASAATTRGRCSTRSASTSPSGSCGGAAVRRPARRRTGERRPDPGADAGPGAARTGHGAQPDPRRSASSPPPTWPTRARTTCAWWCSAASGSTSRCWRRGSPGAATTGRNWSTCTASPR